MTTVTMESPARAAVPTAERKAAPIRWFATLGALFLLLEVYVLGSWLLSGDAHGTFPGPTPVPFRMKAAVVAMSIVGVVGLIGMLYRVVWRGYRREGRLTTDGLLCLAFASLFWQDPIVNYAQNWVGVNAWSLNFGSWASHIPGALSGNSHRFAEAPLWDWTMYVYGVFGLCIPANYLMRKAKARWNLGPAGVLAVCFGVFVAIDLVAEPLFMWLGLWSYAGAVREFTVFGGHYYQFPLYEAVLWPFVWTAFAAVRYFRDDKGRTVAERGLDELRGKAATRATGVRLLAFIGAINLAMLCLYNIPMQIFALHADPWPQDVQKRSYFMDGLCGSGTSYACPGEGVPIPRPGSARLGPDGRLVVPEGAQIPGGSPSR